MERRARGTDGLIWTWTIFVVLVIYAPIAAGFLASLGKSRYFRFPVAQFSFEWWQRTIDSLEIAQLFRTSL
jgi:spermidine/putrescine transport system permease protein